MGLQPNFIGSFPTGGLETDKKPYLLIDQAFPKLENAYLYRERIIKREGNQLLGRLRRTFTSLSLGNSVAINWTFTIYSTVSPAITPQPNAEIESGTVTITVGTVVFTDFSKSGSITAVTQAEPASVTSSTPTLLTTGDIVTINGVVGMTQLNGNSYPITVTGANTFTLDFVDSTGFTPYISGGTWSTTTAQGNGFLVSTTPGNSGTINYQTGLVSLIQTSGVVASTISFNYFPMLPVMGINLREISGINEEQTIFYDTTYAYVYNGTGFQEFIPGFTWDGTDHDFFWSVNYRGASADQRLYFTTNFVNDAGSPMRYTDQTNATWTTFAPGIGGATPNSADSIFLFQARILIPYYGRLVALNTWEGTTQLGSVNIFNRCRFSQIGSPIQQTVVGPPFVGGAWRSDVFGKGGFIDCPINEAIVSAAFFKNTLLVSFERSTWQLRYVGEYGLPFLWERVSSDFGSESTFSNVLFDRGILQVGDKGITSASATNVQRIDEKIPDLVFSFRNDNFGIERIQGIRDFQREIVFWNYVESTEDTVSQKYPDRILVYNYRNNTFAIFRDNVTAFGLFQTSNSITWDSEIVTWDDMDITWDSVYEQTYFPFIVSGNQQGYIHLFGYQTINDPSLSVTAVDMTVSPNVLTIPDHNLDDNEFIYLTGLTFSSTPPANLNNQIYLVTYIDDNNIGLSTWNFVTQGYEVTPIAGSSSYVGNGQVALFPVLNVLTKDFNPYQAQGLQLKLSFIDFLFDATPNAAVSIQYYVNSSISTQGNLLIGNNEVETYLTSPFYVPDSEYAWHRFFATAFGQYINVLITYDDNLMNTLTTHEQDFQLNAMTLWTRPGGKITF